MYEAGADSEDSTRQHKLIHTDSLLIRAPAPCNAGLQLAALSDTTVTGRERIQLVIVQANQHELFTTRAICDHA